MLAWWYRDGACDFACSSRLLWDFDEWMKCVIWATSNRNCSFLLLGHRQAMVKKVPLAARAQFLPVQVQSIATTERILDRIGIPETDGDTFWWLETLATYVFWGGAQQLEASAITLVQSGHGLINYQLWSSEWAVFLKWRTSECDMFMSSCSKRIVSCVCLYFSLMSL